MSDKNEWIKFYLPENDDYVSGSEFFHKGLDKNYIEVEMYTLDSIKKRLGHSHVDILKMDIEGSEFSVIENMTKDDFDIGQICVEIHDRFFDDCYKKYMICAKKLLAWVLI